MDDLSVQAGLLPPGNDMAAGGMFPFQAQQEERESALDARDGGDGSSVSAGSQKKADVRDHEGSPLHDERRIHLGAKGQPGLWQRTKAKASGVMPAIQGALYPEKLVANYDLQATSGTSFYRNWSDPEITKGVSLRSVTLAHAGSMLQNTAVVAARSTEKVINGATAVLATVLGVNKSFGQWLHAPVLAPAEAGEGIAGMLGRVTVGILKGFFWIAEGAAWVAGNVAIPVINWIVKPAAMVVMGIVAMIINNQITQAGFIALGACVAGAGYVAGFFVNVAIATLGKIYQCTLGKLHDTDTRGFRELMLAMYIPTNHQLAARAADRQIRLRREIEHAQLVGENLLRPTDRSTLGGYVQRASSPHDIHYAEVLNSDYDDRDMVEPPPIRAVGADDQPIVQRDEL